MASVSRDCDRYCDPGYRTSAGEDRKGGHSQAAIPVGDAAVEYLATALTFSCEILTILSHVNSTIEEREAGVERDDAITAVDRAECSVVGDPAADGSAMHRYLHTYSEAIEAPYRRAIYAVGVSTPRVN